MKRKRNQTLFFLGSKRQCKGVGHDDSDECEIVSQQNRPQLELILKPAKNFQDGLPLPYELLVKIFQYAVKSSDHPIRDLCNIARVCETWRQIILQSPFLWERIDLSQVPMTKSNMRILRKILETSPQIIDHVKEFAMSGSFEGNDPNSLTLIESLTTAPNLTTLSIRELKPRPHTLPGLIAKSIGRCRQLRSLNITQSRNFFNNQKWLIDHLIENGRYLEELNLALSLTSIPNQLLKAIGSDYCPNLKVLDISTCDALNTHSFDAILLARSMPNLEVLRVGNVSFKRVYSPPEVYGLTKLRELSMPIGMRDADRDDALLATLTFGSDQITALDLRGSCISAQALLDMPSYGVKELHMDDLCPITRRDYHRVIEKWSKTLDVLSLVKINCAETMKSCLNALCDQSNHSRIKDLDLSSSDVTPNELKQFLNAAKSLQSINLSSCRSLPRGCKGYYSKRPKERSTQKLTLLHSKLTG